MLKGKAVDAAHHHDGVKNDQQGRHRTAQSKTAVQDDERNGEQGQPDVRAQPALHSADPPKHQFLAHAEKRGKNEDRQRDRAEDQPERRPADSMMFRRGLQ